ncbi:MAG: hypothetical protein J0H09_09280 [Burkholderiales bacterium]|nr:hypothetical protein [Burkholderiales bacterium]
MHALKPITVWVARSRGRQRPLFQGGASKILLAWLPRHQQRQIYQQHAQQIMAQGMGESWEAFRANLDQIKKAGFYMSWGEIEPNVGAAVVPVFDPNGENVAALNLLDTPENIDRADRAWVKAVLEDAAWKIRQRQAFPQERPAEL